MFVLTKINFSALPPEIMCLKIAAQISRDIKQFQHPPFCSTEPLFPKHTFFGGVTVISSKQCRFKCVQTNKKIAPVGKWLSHQRQHLPERPPHTSRYLCFQYTGSCSLQQRRNTGTQSETGCEKAHWVCLLKLELSELFYLGLRVWSVSHLQKITRPAKALT